MTFPRADNFSSTLCILTGSGREFLKCCSSYREGEHTDNRGEGEGERGGRGREWRERGRGREGRERERGEGEGGVKVMEREGKMRHYMYLVSGGIGY